MLEEKRLFIAIPLSQEWREMLLRYPLRVSFPEKDIRWTPAENLHVTARFLGSVPAVSVPLLCARLEKALAQVAPFSLSLKKMTYAPSRGLISMLWAQFAECPALSCLADAIEEAARVFVQKEKHPAHPPLAHITVARFRRQLANRPLLPFPSAAPPTLPVNTCVLMESALGRSAPRYHAVWSFALREKREDSVV